jgi:hypothetical protein
MIPNDQQQAVTSAVPAFPKAGRQADRSIAGRPQWVPISTEPASCFSASCFPIMNAGCLRGFFLLFWRGSGGE